MVVNLPMNTGPTKITLWVYEQLNQEFTKEPGSTFKALHASLASVKVRAHNLTEINSLGNNERVQRPKPKLNKNNTEAYVSFGIKHLDDPKIKKKKI